ncbi:hypothetical protein NO2_1237 [Candidatus Termititenax persephonae]|uniref:Uncharacterized protein n=1 Tax=Candidatus Termititenax persephonae TaxID=2218525 RepID=A0A388TIH0_9BACT|nr:hypothetical protein NO2_1237 [Candidatus Termititenax persephonae]
MSREKKITDWAPNVQGEVRQSKLKRRIFYLLGLLTLGLLVAAAVSLRVVRPVLLSPPTAEKYNSSGLRKFETGNYSGAIKEYSRAIQLNDSDQDSYFGRANAYLQIYLYKQALADYNKAIELDSANAEYYVNRANAHFGLKNYQTALADYNRAIKMNPKDGRLYLRRALLREKNLDAKPKDLAADWLKAIKLGVKDEYVFVSYGRYLNDELQNFEGALSYFQKALAVNPDNKLAKKNSEIARENIKAKKANL